MTVAIVILNYNGKAHLTQFLPFVVKYSHPHHIVIADNGSTDDSVIFIKQNYPSIHLIEIEENLGFTGGYNYALNFLDQDILVLLNSDVEVTPNWISPILLMMENDNSIAACQPKLLSFDQRSRFEYAGAAGGFIDKLGFPFCRGRVFQIMESDTGQYNNSTRIFWASGACMFIKNELFKSIGGFDEDFFAHMEEIDLCWRLQNAGFSIYYNGDSKVYHVGGGTLSKANPNKTYYNFRNGLSMLIKNEKQGRLWWKLPLRILFDLVAAVKFIFADSWKDGWAVIKAHGYFWTKIGRIIKKRNLAKIYWKKSRAVFYNKFIVIEYYLKGKKKFSDFDSKSWK